MGVFIAFDPITELFRGFTNLWSLGLLLAAGLTLLWFIYSVCLRRLLRMRRIANIRLRRMLSERESSDSSR
jgi:hypothetical protein